MLEVNFWQDKAKSQIVIKEKKLYENLINSYEQSILQFKDLDDLYKLAIEEKNSEIQLEVYQKLKELRVKVSQEEIDKIIKEYKKIKKNEKSNMSEIKKLGLLDTNGNPL